MTNGEAQAIHDRLDRQDEKLDRIVEAVTRQVAICGPTRARVDEVVATTYAKNGTLDRLARLETARQIKGKGLWALVTMALAVIGGTILAGTKLLLSWMRE